MNPYQVLGVSQDATEKEIKSAYRQLVKEYHPDRNKSESAKVIIVRVNEAYEILSDPAKKARYHQPSPAVYSAPSEEERIYEERKKVYRQRQREREIREDALRKAKEEKYFKVGRLLAVPILVFATILIVDQILPENYFQGPAEMGWQQSLSRRGGGTYLSYMRTGEFVIGVPSEVHVAYDYYAKPGLVTIEATPIFKIPKTVQVTLKERVIEFEAKRTVYSFLLPLHYILFLTSLFVVTRRVYSPLNHLIGFLTVFFLTIVLMNILL